jgi:MinD superfamily P-loop ATPase
MIISVASGKGGTGKTLVATSLALSLRNEKSVQFLDCDVEEPDAHLFLKPSLSQKEMVTTTIPKLNEEKCDYCGKCGEVCTRNAIVAFAKHILMFPELCLGCGTCVYLCPKKALTEERKEIGIVESGSSDGVAFTHGRLADGEVMALPIIKKIKEHAKHEGVVIVDASAGTSCLVVEAVRDSDFCILVTEPTPLGRHTLIRAVKTLNRLDIPCGVVLNSTGDGDGRVEAYCREEKIPVLLTIPLDSRIARLYSEGITLAEGMPVWQESFTGLFDEIREIVSERDSRLKR